MPLYSSPSPHSPPALLTTGAAHDGDGVPSTRVCTGERTNFRPESKHTSYSRLLPDSFPVPPGWCRGTAECSRSKRAAKHAATEDSAVYNWRTKWPPLSTPCVGGAEQSGGRKTMNRRGDAERAARVVRAFTYPTRSRVRGPLIRPAPGPTPKRTPLGQDT